MTKEKNSTIDDEIDWKLIDQLHSATSNFSSASLELKKMCLVVLGITIPAVIKLSNDNLDLSLFITVYIITITFWYLDAFTFVHQERLREKMDLRFEKLKKRNSIPMELAVDESGDKNAILSETQKEEYSLEDSRVKETRWWRGFTAEQARMYQVFLLLNSIGIGLFLSKIIK